MNFRLNILNRLQKKKDSTADTVKKLDAEIKRTEDIEIREVKDIMARFSAIQELLEKNEKSILTISDDVEKEIYNTELIQATADNFYNVVNNAHNFIGAVSGLISTCDVAIETDADIKSKLLSSKVFNYDAENREIELKEIKTLSSDEIKILSDSGSLLKYMRRIMAFLGKFPKNGLDGEDEKIEFKSQIKRLKSNYSKINTNILKCESLIKDIAAVLKNIVSIIGDVDARFQGSFTIVSKRITEGKEYRPSNPSGR